MSDILQRAIVRCQYWQGVLRLQDWDVDLKVVRRWEMTSESTVAQVWVSDSRRLATISLLSPVDYRPDQDESTYDLDDSIVHELLHLHLHDLRIIRRNGDDLTPEGVAEERAINALAGAFVGLDRRAA